MATKNNVTEANIKPKKTQIESSKYFIKNATFKMQSTNNRFILGSS